MPTPTDRVISDIHASVQRIQNEARMLRNLMIQHKDGLHTPVLHVIENTEGIIEHAEALTFEVCSTCGHGAHITCPCNHPDNNDRDAGRVCASCQHDLEQDADFRCVRCGTPS
jgi:hypothetical protein